MGLLVKIGADLSNFEKQMKKATKEITAVSKYIGDVGKTMSKYITVPLVAIGGVAFASADSLQKATNTIRAGAGATGEALQELRKDFDEVYRTVPAGADVVATAIADLNTRTGATGETLQGLARQMVELAHLTDGDVSTQIANATRVFGDWGIEVEKQADTLDYLWKVSQSTGIGFDELSGKLVQFGAPLRQMGFDFETSAALIGKWEKEGVNAELVLGSLRIALGKMAKEGITDTNAALKEIIESIKNAGSEGEATALSMEYFGARAGSDMAASIREGRFEIDELLLSIKNSDETIMKAAEDTRTFGDHIAILKNKAALAFEPLGKVLIDLFVEAKPLISDMIGFVADLGKRFGELDPSVQKTIVAVGMFLAALGPALIILSSLINAFTTVKATVLALGPILTALKVGFVGFSATLTSTILPIIAVVAAVGVLIAIGVTLYKNWESITEALKEIWESIKTSFQDTVNNIKQSFSDMWQSVQESVRNGWNSLSNAFSGIFNSIKNWFTGLVKDAFNWGKNMIDGFINGIKSMASAVGNAVKGVMGKVGKFIGFNSPAKEGEGRFIEDWGANMIDGFMDGIKRAQPQLDNFLNDIVVTPKATDPVGRGIEIQSNNTQMPTTSNSPNVGNINPNEMFVVAMNGSTLKTLQRKLKEIGISENARGAFGI